MLSAFGRKRQWEVKDSHSCTLTALMRPVCWEKRFPIPGWKLLWTDKRRVGQETGICLPGDVKTAENKTVLDIELKQIITAGVTKWGPDNRLQQKQGWLGDRTSSTVRFWFPDFSVTHLHIWDKICSGEVQSQSQIYFNTALLFAVLPKNHICFSFAPAANNNSFFSESKVFHYSPCVLQGAAHTGTTTPQCPWVFQLLPFQFSHWSSWLGVSKDFELQEKRKGRSEIWHWNWRCKWLELESYFNFCCSSTGPYLCSWPGDDWREGTQYSSLLKLLSFSTHSLYKAEMKLLIKLERPA